MHVSLCRPQIGVSASLLNRTRRCGPHRKVRTETVTKNVDAPERELRRPRGMIDVVADHLFIHRVSLPINITV